MYGPKTKAAVEKAYKNKVNSSSETWVRIPSGWLAAIYGGSKYIK